MTIFGHVFIAELNSISSESIDLLLLMGSCLICSFSDSGFDGPVCNENPIISQSLLSTISCAKNPGS